MVGSFVSQRLSSVPSDLAGVSGVFVSGVVSQRVVFVCATRRRRTKKRRPMCNCERLMSVSGKTSDMCFIRFPSGRTHEGYPPCDVGIGGGDYIEFELCMDCGKIQGEFPVEEPEGEDDEEE